MLVIVEISLPHQNSLGRNRVLLRKGANKQHR